MKTLMNAKCISPVLVKTDWLYGFWVADRKHKYLLTRLIWNIYSSNRENKLLQWLKSVKANEHDDVSWVYDYHIMLNIDREEYAHVKELDFSKVPYQWWDGEVYDALSWHDVTYVNRYDIKWEEWFNSAEIYSTPEIIQVLEKRIEYLERRNNPEERIKMIEEYERERGEK